MSGPTNLNGTIWCSRAAVRVMMRARKGRIVNLSSHFGSLGSRNRAAYAASKSGVESFVRVLASELGPDGITVNAYAPGMIPTEMNHFAEREPEVQERLLDTLSLRRWGDPRDVANLIVFLASDQAAYITGALIDVSGGKFATQMPWMAYR